MSGTPPPVCAVVLAQGDHARLARALAAVAWAAERVVLDPAERMADADLPAGVGRCVDPAAIASVARSAWVLLLCENEVPSPAFVAAVVAAVDDVPVAWAVRRDLHGLGVQLAMRGAPVRLAPRQGVRVSLRIGLQLVLELPAPLLVQRIGAPLVVDYVPTLDEAVRTLDAESTTFAALLERIGRRPRLRGLLVNPWVAAGCVLAGRAATRVGLGRWILAVLLGYRVVVAHAKLWERGRDRVLAAEAA
ncbi:MAG: hypothetical protein KIT14_18935 [bacterium]|nr:hypothetical protein [bacterium]